MILRSTRTALLAGAAALLAPAALAAQETTATAGPEYRAGSFKRWLLGRDYRDLWTAPVRVEVLDLGTFAGGLTPTEKGGGAQTLGLRFRGADGREYGFRSVNKDPGKNAPPDIKGTLVEEVLDDQVSSLVPAAPLFTDVVEDAAGILHPRRRLVVMPDDPRLGPFREEFAGVLGTIEERPDEGKTGDPVMARAAAIESDAPEFFKALRGSAAQRFDSRDYLRVRLVDLFMNDWDRHEDQYRWARFDAGGASTWRAIPTDRDYAMVDYDGFLPSLARSVVTNAIPFRATYRGTLPGLLLTAQDLDRWLLADLPRATWDSVALDLRARLTDEVIDRALARLPAEYVRLEGAQLRTHLRSRRDLLPEVAAEFYGTMSREAEVNGKDAEDVAEVERLAGGGVEVVLRSASGAEYYRRRFVPEETREVRVFLHGGADRARVFGPGEEERIVVRVVGGDGVDEMRDETRSGRKTAFYDRDGRDATRIIPRPGTKVDLRPWTDPEFVRGGGRTPLRDWGLSSSLVSPKVGWRRHVGPVVGIGPSRTRHGFRRFPFASSQDAALLWAPLETRFAVEYDGDFRYVGSRDRLVVEAHASNMQATRFHGFGNQSPELDTEVARLWERQLLLEPTFFWGISRTTFVSVGGTVRWTDPETEAGTPASLLASPGTRSYGIAGPRVGLLVDARDSAGYPRRGFTLEATAGGYPLAWSDAESFAETRAVGTAYLSAGRRGPTLALRAGGERVWGDFPLQYAAFIGGGGSLRGHQSQRYAGDMAAFGSAELRQVLTRAELVTRGDLGVFALADAGRVWFDGDSDGGWHKAYGGGIFFHTLGRTLSVSYAYGERGVLYFDFGVPF